MNTVHIGGWTIDLSQVRAISDWDNVDHTAQLVFYRGYLTIHVNKEEHEKLLVKWKGQPEMNRLSDLLGSVSYYNAAEGEMWHKERVQREASRDRLREYLSTKTVAEVKAEWPMDEGHFRHYLVIPDIDVWPHCKDGGNQVEETIVEE